MARSAAARVSSVGGGRIKSRAGGGPAEGSPEPASRPLRFVVLLGRGFVAASVLCLGALCGFAVLVLSAPARAILSRSGLGAAYGPSRGKPQVLFDNLRRWSALVFSIYLELYSCV